MPKRTQNRGMPAPDGSWVFENTHKSEDEFSDGDEQSSEEGYEQPTASLKRSAIPRTKAKDRVRMSPKTKLEATSSRPSFKSGSNITRKNFEPQLVMPSMSGSSAMEASWVQQEEPSTQTRSTIRRRHDKPTRRAGRSGEEFHSTNPESANHRGDRGLTHTTGVFNAAGFSAVAWSVCSYIGTTLSMIFSILKPCFAYGIALWMLAYMARLLFTSAITRTLAPVCSLPGISYLALPFCTVSRPHGPVEFEELITIQSAFEDVLAASTKDARLPIDMKKSESSIRDLKYVVQYSTLPSRNELVLEFTGFLDSARQASADLSRFNSRVGRAIDHVLSTNKWTLQVLDDIAEREAAKGAIGRFLKGTILVPFQSSQLTEDILLNQYLRHTSAIEDQILELIMEAQALLGILQNLDDRLDIIQGITTRDGVKVKGSRDELFGYLWTKLGGNRSSRKKHDEQLRLLKEVNLYRKTAWEHVSATIVKLQSIAAGLEDLRERVATPEVLGGYEPLPLRMHIEHIQLGVDRLEQQRIEAREAESAQHRRTLDKGALPAEPKYLDS